MGAVAVTALVQASRIAEAEGGTDSVGFISGSILETDSLFGRSKNIALYDEAASVSGCLKVIV